MTQTDKALSKIINNYNPEKNIKKTKMQQKKAHLIAEAKKIDAEKIFQQKKAKEQAKEEKPVETPNYEALDQAEKEFITAFIEYNELMLLNDSNKKLIECFNKSLGENAKAALEELQKRMKDRADKLKELTKKLADIKDTMIKETEKIKAKESLISMFNTIAGTFPEKKEDTTEIKPDKTDFPKNIVENKKKK